MEHVLKNIIGSLGNTLSRLQGKYPQSKRNPYLVVWNFTDMCNLRCKHCYQDAKSKPSADELSLDEKLVLVDTLHEAGIKVPMISGGEPLIHPDYFPVLEKLASTAMHPAAASNATMITPEFAGRLKDSGLGYIEISLDSVTPKKHNDFRGMPGAWEKTVEGIRNCIKNR